MLILLTSTLVPGINYFVVTTHPLHQLQVRKRSSSSCYILLTSTLVPGINYFVVTTHPLHQLQVRKRSSSSCYMIETYNTRHRFPFIVCYRYYTNKTIFLI